MKCHFCTSWLQSLNFPAEHRKAELLARSFLELFSGVVFSSSSPSRFSQQYAAFMFASVNA